MLPAFADLLLTEEQNTSLSLRQEELPNLTALSSSRALQKQELVRAAVDLQMIYLLFRSHLADGSCDPPEHELRDPPWRPTSVCLDGQLRGIPN